MQTFHYTSPQKLCSIINSRSFYAARIVDLPEDQREFSALDATLQHLESLNSQHEVNNLVVFCKNELEKHRDNIYEISFCKNGHSEFMWNNYAKDGCCICFNKEKLLEAFGENKRRIVDFGFGDCLYVEEDTIHKRTLTELNNMLKTNSALKQKRVHCTTISSFEDLNKTDEELSSSVLEVISVDDVFDSIAVIPTRIKLGGAEHSFPKEEEDRLVILGKDKDIITKVGDRFFLVLNLKPDSFLASISSIQLDPNSQIKSEIKSAIENELDSVSPELLQKWFSNEANR